MIDTYGTLLLLLPFAVLTLLSFLLILVAMAGSLSRFAEREEKKRVKVKLRVIVGGKTDSLKGKKR